MTSAWPRTSTLQPEWCSGTLSSTSKATSAPPATAFSFVPLAVQNTTELSSTRTIAFLTVTVARRIHAFLFLEAGREGFSAASDPTRDVSESKASPVWIGPTARRLVPACRSRRGGTAGHRPEWRFARLPALFRIGTSWPRVRLTQNLKRCRSHTRPATLPLANSTGVIEF